MALTILWERDTRASSHHPMKIKWEGDYLHSGRESKQDLLTCILDISDPELWKINDQCLLFKPFSLWYFVIVVQTETYSCDTLFSDLSPGGLVVKNLPEILYVGDVGLIPGLGRSPGGENGSPLQYSCLKNPMNRGAWQARVHGVSKTCTRLSRHTHVNDLLNEKGHLLKEFKPRSLWGLLFLSEKKQARERLKGYLQIIFKKTRGRGAKGSWEETSRRWHYKVSSILSSFPSICSLLDLRQK